MTVLPTAYTLIVPFQCSPLHQVYINKALRGLVDDFCIIYLDDILIFSKTKEEYDKHLQQVCDRLRQAELYAKPSKCQFYQKELEFLGLLLEQKAYEQT